MRSVVKSSVSLPPEVDQLSWREREIASTVYFLRAATASDVRDNLSTSLANASVRSMLNRLVAKGILKRTLSGKAFVYLPALTSSDSRALALKRFADDYFSGSVQQAASAMRRLLGANRGLASPKIMPGDDDERNADQDEVREGLRHNR